LIEIQTETNLKINSIGRKMTYKLIKVTEEKQKLKQKCWETYEIY